MISDKFLSLVQRTLPFELTEVQQDVVRRIGTFLFSGGERSAYMLRGYAGTGKTFIMSAIVRVLHSLGREVVLLAPTGRAAKVLALHAGYPAYTIHKEIYRQDKVGDLNAHFVLGFNKHKDAVFIVDEASMIANEDSLLATFGTGSLLDDLLAYVYSSEGCSMILVGDNAQLPPVGEEESPALRVDVLRGMGLSVTGYQLTTVMRQAEESGVLWNATELRKLLTAATAAGGEMPLPRIRFRGFADIARISGADMVESLEADYDRYGQEQVVVITRSNKRAVEYNLGIRNTILDREDELTTGDLLMVVKNKYLTPPTQDSASGAIDFIANGDRARVQRVRNVRDLYGFRFADVWLQFPDYDDYEMTSTVLLDTLTTEAPALTHEQSDQLFQAVLEDYSDIPQKAERMKKMKEDPYYNALQVKFAYAVTCHKAQGGQWAHVYIDQGYMTDDMLTPDYVRWLYTAFTRATDKVFLVNWPKNQEE